MNNSNIRCGIPCLFFKCFIIFFYYSAQLAEVNFLNVQILPESPTQDVANAILSFFVDLPSGTMSSEVLTIIFMSSPNVLSQPVSSTTTPLPITETERENAVSVRLMNFQANEVR